MLKTIYVTDTISKKLDDLAIKYGTTKEAMAILLLFVAGTNENAVKQAGEMSNMYVTKGEGAQGMEAKGW